jgi:hypothetical protein
MTHKALSTKLRVVYETKKEEVRKFTKPQRAITPKKLGRSEENSLWNSLSDINRVRTN